VLVISRRTAIDMLSVGVLLLLLAAALAGRASTAEPPAAGSPVTATAPTDPVTAALAAAQERLADVPGDWRTWAELGTVYVEQARITADPSYYAQAEGALDRSMELRSEDNDLALAGLGALANARHDFAGAEDLADRALAINPYSAMAWGVMADARTQLGDYDGAAAAVGRMLELRPGVASFTRASYDAELRGDVASARAALEQALELSVAPADEAYCLTYLGGLAFSQGDLAEAERRIDVGRTVLPDDPALLLGRARVAAAKGETDLAARTYERVVRARPLPENLVEYGEFLLAVGNEKGAADQFAVLADVRRLFAANGVSDDLGVAQFEADHGDPLAAVAAARAEFGRRQNVDAHDALGWALHRAGRDAEALEHARAATALGGASARFLYHRGVIEAALGDETRARATLAEALDRNPYFSPLYAPRAEALLDSLGGRP
jgi:tetratricopeptide (TPR) repeat protein